MTLCIIKSRQSKLSALGGDEGDRTLDLLNAIQALSQTELRPHSASRSDYISIQTLFSQYFIFWFYGIKTLAAGEENY